MIHTKLQVVVSLGGREGGGKEARRLVSRVLFFDWVGVGFMGV